MLAANAVEEATAAVEMSVKRVGAIDDLQCLDNDLDKAEPLDSGWAATPQEPSVITARTVRCTGRKCVTKVMHVPPCLRADIEVYLQV